MGNTENANKNESIIIGYCDVFECFYSEENGQMIEDETVVTVLKYKYPNINFDANFITGLKTLMETQHIKLKL